VRDSNGKTVDGESCAIPRFRGNSFAEGRQSELRGFSTAGPELGKAGGYVQQGISTVKNGVSLYISLSF
jgi:hypothetical protein